MKTLFEYLLGKTKKHCIDHPMSVEDKIINNGDGIYLIPNNGSYRFSINMCIIKDEKCLKLSEKDLEKLHTEATIIANTNINFVYNIGYKKDDYYGIIGPNEAQNYISKEYNINKMYFVSTNEYEKSDLKRIQDLGGFSCDII